MENDGFRKADLHYHLHSGSRVKSGDLERVLSLSRERLGVNGILGLVNFSDKRYDDLVRQGVDRRGFEIGEDGKYFYDSKNGVYLVRGQEIATMEGHLLVLGVDEQFCVKDGLPLRDSLKFCQDGNGMIVVPHPFLYSGLSSYLQKHDELINEYVDAMECHNGNGWTKFNSNLDTEVFFAPLSRPYKFGMLSNSDGHSLNELGSSWTGLEDSYFKEDNFLDGLREAVQNVRSMDFRKNGNSYSGACLHFCNLAVSKIAM